MTDSTLQRVWDSREAIARRCAFDPHKLVQYYQSRQGMNDRITINLSTATTKPKVVGGKPIDMEV